MGGQTDVLSKMLRERHSPEMSLTDAIQLAVEAIASVGGEGGKPRTIDPNQLEIAVLDRARPGRKFRRITGAALTPLLAPVAAEVAAPAEEAPAAPATDEATSADDAAAATETSAADNGATSGEGGGKGSGEGGAASSGDGDAGEGSQA